MLKLAMPKGFCLKKKKKSYQFCPSGRQAGRQFCRELGSALPLSKSQGGFTSSSYRVNVFLCSKTPILTKDEFGCLFPALSGKREVTTKTVEGESHTHPHHPPPTPPHTHAFTETASRPGSPAPLLFAVASLDRQGESTRLRMKTPCTTLRLSLVFL